MIRSWMVYSQQEPAESRHHHHHHYEPLGFDVCLLVLGIIDCDKGPLVSHQNRRLSCPVSLIAPPLAQLVILIEILSPKFSLLLIVVIFIGENGRKSACC